VLVDSDHGSGGKLLRSVDLETYACLDGSMLNRREPYSFYFITRHELHRGPRHELHTGLLLLAGGPRYTRCNGVVLLEQE
jgi:hypothetical protein